MSSASFELLDPRIQRWIWSNGWTQMRDAQERAVPFVIDADRDVIIAAATASGKTEAAFLPVLTHILREGNEGSLVIYISPLKALINDQFGRMEQLCESLNIAVWPWHGDINASCKTRFFKKSSGVLLITPESLEAMFCTRGTQLTNIFSKLKYIVVDELHAFIGSERGKQLQSLMHRVEIAIGRCVSRIGLSATLGNMQLGADFLRPSHGLEVSIVQSESSGGYLKVQLRGYSIHKTKEAPVVSENESDADSPNQMMATQSSIAAHIFKYMRGSNNLIFPNSRGDVEAYTFLLRKLCDEAGVPNEYWPHHGSLSKYAREETERALKDTSKHSTAICTNTLELGIDIGDITSVAQIGCPPSVASLRQRIGRSGRREGTSAILRGYIPVDEIDAKSDLFTLLREDLFQFTAMISLLLENWFEPPNPNGYHLSTFIQQLLSMISQWGGVSAAKAYRELIETGPFRSMTKSDYVLLLRHLGTIKLIEQDSSGLLLLGEKGESAVNHYTFYAAFATDEEYRLYCGTELLGTMPVKSMLFVDQIIIFSGRTWQVTSVDEEAKVIQLQHRRGGRPPLFMSESNRNIHQKIRERMRLLYIAQEAPLFLDKEASYFFKEGQQYYKQFVLEENHFISDGRNTYLFTWMGDNVNNTVAVILRLKGVLAKNCGAMIEVTTKPSESKKDVLEILNVLANEEPMTIHQLLNDAAALRVEKWDWALPDELIQKGYASLNLDIERSYKWIKDHFGPLEHSN